MTIDRHNLISANEYGFFTAKARSTRSGGKRRKCNSSCIEFLRELRGLSGGTPPRAVKSLHSGFTFLEVLFSVIIIGVGIVMVASMFPVAVEQQQANVSEAAAVAVGKDALRYIQSVTASFQPGASGSSLSLLPVTNNTLPVTSPAQALITNVSPIMPLPNEIVKDGNTNLIAQNSAYPVAGAGANTTDYRANPAAVALSGNPGLTQDHRFGWIGFYRRDMIAVGGQTVLIGGTPTLVGAQIFPSPFAQVWIITAQSQNDTQPNFASGPTLVPATAGPVMPTYPSANFFPGPSAASSTAVNKNVVVTIANPNSTNITTGNAYQPGVSTITFTGYTGIGVLHEGAIVLVTGFDPAGANQPTQTQANQILGWYATLGAAIMQDATKKIYIYALLTDPPPNLIDTTVLPNTKWAISNFQYQVFVLGAPVNPDVFTSTAQPFIGLPQDITCTTGFVRINN